MLRRAAAAVLASLPATTSAAAPTSTTWARVASSAAAGPSSSSSSKPKAPSPPPPPTGDAALFTIVGRLDGPVAVKPRPVYAVVEISGTQYKVSPDDLIYTNALADAGVNDVLHLTRVLAVGTRTHTAIGRPVLQGSAVKAAVEEVGRDAKVLTFWKRRRKASRRLGGHRQPITALRILDVLGEGGASVLGET